MSKSNYIYDKAFNSSIIENNNKIYDINNNFTNNKDNQNGINELKQEISDIKNNLSFFGKKMLSQEEENFDDNNIFIKKLQSEKEILSKENIEKENIIKELNYKIIELKQKISLNESNQNLLNKINLINNKNGQQNELLEKLKIENFKLQNKINELELNNSKLIFDNESLLNKIKFQDIENKNENKLKNFVVEKKINYFYKQIELLNLKINDELFKKQNIINNFNFNISKNNMMNYKDIYDKFNEMRKKILLLDEKNFYFKKENQNLENIIQEFNIILKGKEQIILQLKNNLLEINNRLFLYKNMNNNESYINLNKNNKNKYKDMVNQLLTQNEKINKENIILKEKNKKIINEVNEINILFSNKDKENEKIIFNQQEKMKEYKYKISLLKIKINELYNEIANLKGQLINNKLNNKNFEEEIQNENKFSSPNQLFILDNKNQDEYIEKNNYNNNEVNNVDENYINKNENENKNILNNENKNTDKNNINSNDNSKKINIMSNRSNYKESIYDNSFEKSPIIIGQNNQKIKIHVNNENNNKDIIECEENNNIEEIEEDENEDEKDNINNNLNLKDQIGKKKNNKKNNINNNFNNNMKLKNTQKFINENINDDQKQLQFIKEYKDILNKVDENINFTLNKFNENIK